MFRNIAAIPPLPTLNLTTYTLALPPPPLGEMGSGLQSYSYEADAVAYAKSAILGDDNFFAQKNLTPKVH